MTDRIDTDKEIDDLGEVVRRSFADESLTAEQQQHHLRRLTRVPGDGAWQGRAYSGLQLVAGMTAVAVVAVILVLAFQGFAGWRDADQPADGEMATHPPRGWTYPGAELPGGGQLAFVSNQDGVPQIAVINADGSGLRTVTSDASTHWGPIWSPDGRQLTWASDSRGAAQVYVAGADGANLVQHSTFLDSRDPIWSPDGAWIAFVSTRDGRTDIYVMPAGGGREVIVTNGVALQPGANLTWSPDSRSIVFETAGDIYIVSRDGSELRQLTDHPADDAAPDWSPDGSRIAFFSNRDGNSEIYVINIDGSDLTNLTETPDDEYQPVWSPDGWTIAYLRAPAKIEPDYETQLWSMGANGAGPRRLGDITGYGMSAPAWSPDSRQLAVVAAPEDSDLTIGTLDDGRLYVITAGGADQRLIHDRAADLGRPSWRPLWWPEEMIAAPATEGVRPELTLDPATGDCSSQVVARGSGFKPGVVVTLYGAPAIDDSFAIAAGPVVVAADGSFETPLDLTRFAGCAGDTPPGGDFHIGAATERGQRHGAALADLSASAVFAVRE